MEEINHIEKAIEYLQDLKNSNAKIDRIEINYGFREAIPTDKNYCEWARTQVPDGSFYMQIYGRERLK